MARLDYMIAAQAVAVDRETNALSIFNVIDDMQVPADIPEPPEGSVVPGAFPFTVVAVWMRTSPDVPETVDSRVVVIGPRNKQPLTTTEFRVEMTEAIVRSRSMFRLPFFPYQGPGTYSFVVQIKGDHGKWRRAGSRELTIKKATTSTAGARAK